MQPQSEHNIYRDYKINYITGMYIRTTSKITLTDCLLAGTSSLCVWGWVGIYLISAQVTIL